MLLMIKGGRVIDPDNIDGIMDIYIADGKITEIVPHGLPPSRYPAVSYLDTKIKQIDATGKIVTPGLIDMHVHLREPGHEHKETIESGCLAAAHGGFTAVCAMPNTNPVNDCRQVTEYILNKARDADTIRVYPVAAISQGLKGKALCDYEDLRTAGAVAVSDDGNPVMNSRLMRKALEYAEEFGLLVISHCEDIELAGNGVMNEGTVATRMGCAGIPNAAESIMVLRDIELAELTGVHIHIAHVSTRESVRAIRHAKNRGLPVTAETAPHYFTLTDESVETYNTHAKMNPPLRAPQDRKAVRKGLADGTIDVIATDHAPHSSLEKDVEFDSAANGIIGLETSLSLSLKLVEDQVLTFKELIEKMSINPSRILGFDYGLNIGQLADISIIDPDKYHQFNANKF
ncbi:MAG: dihydroorotase, partial [Desulfobacterales bacterium]